MLKRTPPGRPWSPWLAVDSSTGLVLEGLLHAVAVVVLRFVLALSHRLVGLFDLAEGVCLKATHCVFGSGVLPWLEADLAIFSYSTSADERAEVHGTNSFVSLRAHTFEPQHEEATRRDFDGEL